MRYFYLLIILFTANTFSLDAQTDGDCKCCSPQHEQFDFWVGNWEVFDENGDQIGTNKIEKLENNCLISENWKGAQGGSGRSFNYFDPADSTWNQLWVSNTGNILKLKGTAGKDKMVLKSELVEGEKGKYYNQITWTLNSDGSVTQLWEILDENGNYLSEAFKGIYRKMDTTTEK